MARRKLDATEVSPAAARERARQAVHQVTGGSPDLMDMLALLDSPSPETDADPSEQRSEGTPSGELPSPRYGQVVERSTAHLGCVHHAPTGNTGAIPVWGDFFSEYFGGGF